MEPKVIESRSWSHPGSDTKKTLKKMRKRSQNELKRASQKHHKIMKNVTSDPSAGPGAPTRPQRYPPDPKSHRKASKRRSKAMPKSIKKGHSGAFPKHTSPSKKKRQSTQGLRGRGPESRCETRRIRPFQRLHLRCRRQAEYGGRRLSATNHISLATGPAHALGGYSWRQDVRRRRPA